MIQDEIIYMKNAGRMGKGLIYVEDNVYDIPRRLREEVDPSFIVMFNPRTQKHEIHRRGRDDCSLELNIPFNELDERAIVFALKSRDVARVRKEIEEHNKTLDREKQKVLENEQQWKTKELFDYCYHHMDKEDFGGEAYTTRFV